MRTYIMTGKTSDFTTFYSPSIRLDSTKRYEAALLSIDMYNSIPNITDENNEFRYTTDKGKNWKTIKLDIGSYELSAINDEIQLQMKKSGDYNVADGSYYIDISANISKLKSVINITNADYAIDFVPNQNSVGSVLGWNGGVLSGIGQYDSPNIVDIIKINSLLVNIDIIMGSFVNGVSSPTIYSFYPNVPPGFKLIQTPMPQLIYYPVSRTEIDSMRCWITDQNGKPVDLRGEAITIRLAIKEVPSMKNEIINAVKQMLKDKVIKDI